MSGGIKDIGRVKNLTKRENKKCMIARHAKTKRSAKNKKKGEHVVNSVIHACEESNRRLSYIKGRRIRKRRDLSERNLNKKK